MALVGAHNKMADSGVQSRSPLYSFAFTPPLPPLHSITPKPWPKHSVVIIMVISTCSFSDWASLSSFLSFQGFDFFLCTGKFQGCRCGLHFPAPICILEWSFLFFMESSRGNILLLTFINSCYHHLSCFPFLSPSDFYWTLSMHRGSGLQK